MTNIQPQTGGGGWISGPSTTTPHRDLPAVQPIGSEIELSIDPNAADHRPQYNPAALVRDVADLLDRAGVQTDLTDRHHVAAMRAADLLTAMGVKPSSVPRRPGLAQ